MKRGHKFKLSFLPDECTVTAVRLGTLYFRSGEDRYQMPLETFKEPQQIQEQCGECGGYGGMEVTHDMAIDAGNRSLSGQLITCGACSGNGWIATSHNGEEAK